MVKRYTYLTSRRRTVNEGAMEALQALEMVTVHVAYCNVSESAFLRQADS